MIAAPACAKSGTMRSTGFTIRCTSIGTLRCGRIASHTSGPDREVGNVMVVHHVEVDEVGAGGDDRRAPPRRGARNRRTGCAGRCGTVGAWAIIDFKRAECTDLRRWPTKRYEIQRRGHRAVDLSSPTSRTGEEDRYVFAYTITHHQQRQRRRAAREPPLDHHRRRQPGAGSARRGRRRRSSRCSSPARASSTTSGASIPTPVGTMRGSYQMVAEDGTRSTRRSRSSRCRVPRTLH